MLEIRKTKKNQLLHREEIVAEAIFEGVTPSRQALLKEAAKRLSCPENLLSIQKVTNLYGEQKAEVLLHKYDTKEFLDKLEPAYFAKKGKPKDAAKSEAAKPAKA